jgi:hypothetical protein
MTLTDYDTLRLGMDELEDEAAMRMPEIRRSGGGRKSALESIAGLESAGFGRFAPNPTCW